MYICRNRVRPVMEAPDTSHHMCLVCNATVVGLLNYVNHFKTHALPDTVVKPDERIKSTDTKSSNKIKKCKKPKLEPKEESLLSTDAETKNDELNNTTSSLSKFIDSTDLDDQDLDGDAILSPTHGSDFFQSLELKSTSDEVRPKPKLKAIQRLSILEDDYHAECLLPITAILSNLDFSSEDEDNQISHNPPESHTGGKWKPVEAGKRRQYIASKWGPGEKPGPASWKRKKKDESEVIFSQNDKEHCCESCPSKFASKECLTEHISQVHKTENEKSKEVVPANKSTETETKSTPPKRTPQQAKQGGSCYCPVCDLYFTNVQVFSSHCNTKTHKENMLNRGYREYRGNDGLIIRIGVQNEEIYLQKPEDAYIPEDTPKVQESSDKMSEAEEEHECAICQKKFARKYEMARHLLTKMHRNRAMNHKQADSVQLLNRYNKYMMRLSPFQCGVCRFYFNRQQDFLNHVMSTNHLNACHRLLVPVMCAACKFKSHDQNKLLQHLEQSEHLEAVERKHGICIIRESHSDIVCKFCGVKMSSSLRLKRHCQRRHSDRISQVKRTLDVKPVQTNSFKCPICHKCFRASRILQLHFLKMHKHSALFKCETCKRGFLDQRRLDNHLRTSFHARKVVKSKLKISKQFVENTTSTKRGRGRPKGAKNKLTSVKKNKGSIIEKENHSCRSSSRKRKKVEFFDEMYEKTANKQENDESLSNIEDVDDDKDEDYQPEEVKETPKSMKTVFNSKSDEIEHESDKTDILSRTDKGEDSVLDANVLKEASKSIFSCVYCSFGAEDLLELRTHYHERHPNEVLTCQPCNQYFLSLKAYKIHCSGRGHQLKLRESSGDTKIHKCPVCDRRFLQESCCMLHLETVHRHPSCEEDIKRLNKGQDMVTQLYGDHIAQVENMPNDVSVSCPEFCGKFVRKDALVEHLRLHTGERPYACRFCSKSFAGRLTLRRHISTHLNMPLFICDTCGKEFKRSAFLNKHIKQHELEKTGVKFACHVCKATFLTSEELQRHMRRHGDRNFKCTWPGCKWTFVLAGELKSHMFTHTGERKYLCDICGFGAPTKNRLRRHEKIHSNVKNFQCDYCPYKAGSKTHLKRHMRIHTKSRPFSCPYCHYTCNTHENIRKHILKTQKHKGLKLYPCKLCKTFACNSSREFRGHLMSVHADYLKENSVDSLALFSGLYKREDDYQKPKEGSEIIQVTKGRFFKKYQNPSSIVEPEKPKKTKKDKQSTDCTANVSINENTQNTLMEAVSKDHLHTREIGNDSIPQEVIIKLNPPPDIQIDLDENQFVQHVEQPMDNRINISIEDHDRSQAVYKESVLTIRNSYDTEQPTPNVVQFTDNSLPPGNESRVVLKEPDNTSLEKVYWTGDLAQANQPLSVSVPVVQSPTEPWYSGMPQVYPPSSQDLEQQVDEAATIQTSSLLPASGSYLYNIEGVVTAGDRTASNTNIYQNVVLLSSQVQAVGLPTNMPDTN